MCNAGLQGGGGVSQHQALCYALPATGDRDQDVGHAAGFQVVEHPQPEFGPLATLDPQPEDVASAVGAHAHGQVDRLVAQYVVLLDLDPQGVEEDHRIHRFQWPRLPGGDF